MNLVMISVIDIVFQKRNNFFMNQSCKILWLMVILFFIGSCSPKPEPEPKPVAKVKSKKDRREAFLANSRRGFSTVRS